MQTMLAIGILALACLYLGMEFFPKFKRKIKEFLPVSMRTNSSAHCGSCHSFSSQDGKLEQGRNILNQGLK